MQILLATVGISSCNDAGSIDIVVKEATSVIGQARLPLLDCKNKVST